MAPMHDFTIFQIVFLWFGENITPRGAASTREDFPLEAVPLFHPLANETQSNEPRKQICLA